MLDAEHGAGSALIRTVHARSLSYLERVSTAVRIRLKRCPLQKFPDLDRVGARMREPEHVTGARHDDFLRTLYALQEDPRGLFADQPVFLGSEDQRGDVDLLQQRCIVRPN
jgi:hypothetical protein